MSESETGKRLYELWNFAKETPNPTPWADLPYIERAIWFGVDTAHSENIGIKARDDALREAARIVTEHYEALTAEHRLLLLNRATSIISAIEGDPGE